MGPTATRGLPTDNQVAVRPGGSSGAAQVEGWLWDYAAGRDPALGEQIILAYLGLADRPAARYRTGRGAPWKAAMQGLASWRRPSATHPPSRELADPLQVTVEVLEEL